MIDKSILRQELLIKRRSLTNSEVCTASKKITKIISCWPLYKDANVIMSYLSMPEEPQTDELIINAIQLEKIICVPRLLPRYGYMEAVRLFSLNDAVRCGKLGLRQPDTSKSETISPESIDLVLVPGMAFDLQGNRLGMGAGYYDRFLPSAQNAIFAGIAWDFQIVSSVPNEDHDIALDFLVTESGVFNCKQGKM